MGYNEETAEDRKANKRMKWFFIIYGLAITFLIAFHLGYYWPNPDYTMTAAQAAEVICK